MSRILLLVLLAGCDDADPVTDDGGAADLSAASDAGNIDAATSDLSGPCPALMALVDVPDAGRACVDRYEGALMERADGGERLFPHWSTLGSADVRAIPAEGIKPQGYISQVEATAACNKSGKRLCTLPEWMAACQGAARFTYPYGNTYMSGACNEGRATNPVNDCFGNGGNVFTYQNMNDPCCDMVQNGIAPGGAFTMCVSSWGVYDLHGNRHEWIDATSPTGNGIFKGGFFVDARLNGAGCNYRTTAHAKTYHDYSTGFRCCADPRK